MRVHKVLLLVIGLLLNFPAMADENDFAKRLQILEDKEAIRTLLLNYGRYLDNRDWQAFSELFAPERGTWDGGMGVAHNPAEIRDMMISTIGIDNTGSGSSSLSNLHFLGNEFISVEGDTANALSKWVFIMTAAAGGPEAVFVGHYEDELVKLGTHWKFSRRTVHGDIMRPSAINELNPPAP